jgi:hypothetical protein
LLSSGAAVRRFYLFLYTAKWIRPLKTISAYDLDAAVEIARVEIEALKGSIGSDDFDPAHSGMMVTSPGGRAWCTLVFVPPYRESDTQITVKFALSPNARIGKRSAKA